MKRFKMKPLDGSCNDLGGLSVENPSKNEIGRCNFCASNHHVYVVSGSRLKIMMCFACIKKLAKLAKYKTLEAAGWKVGDAVDFLEMSDDERQLLED